ncbi:MAG: CDP-diacylglycerol--glycerol-3-phosphate 3-phosphatidyltransferase [Gudongella sp.]|nr:CDP-diacylglycerol--glycerol-3-phosphate 3-phosphatidyltransferase [Gudongella sp.]
MTLPNIITIFRIFLVPVYLYIFFGKTENSVLLAGLIFMLAGISDVLDGYIARKYNLTSKLGAVLDPFADKLMSFTVLVTFTIIGLVPLWILVPMILKELVMVIGGGLLYLKHGKLVIPSNKYGKIATLSLYAAIFTIVFKINFSISDLLLVLTLFLNLVAFYNYLIIFKKLLIDKKNEVDKNEL